MASVVNFLNPGTVVLGGGALRVGDSVVRAFEETVRGRTTKLAEQRLTVRPASLDFREGVTGAAILAIEQLFAPASVGIWIENGSARGPRRATPARACRVRVDICANGTKVILTA